MNINECDRLADSAAELPPSVVLLPCPFCGGEAECHNANGKYSIACINKDHACMVGPCTQTFSSIDGSVLAWNLRMGQATALPVQESGPSQRVDAA
jgi:hypothetical protein